jgi:hypothetical protein
MRRTWTRHGNGHDNVPHSIHRRLAMENLDASSGQADRIEPHCEAASRRSVNHWQADSGCQNLGCVEIEHKR